MDDHMDAISMASKMMSASDVDGPEQMYLEMQIRKTLNKLDEREIKQMMLHSHRHNKNASRSVHGNKKKSFGKNVYGSFFGGPDNAKGISGSVMVKQENV